MTLHIRIPRGRAATPPPPLGMAGWWSALDMVAADMDPIASFTDLSGNGRDLTTAIDPDATAPAYRTNVINGKPVIRFDGATGGLNRDQLGRNDAVFGADSFTCFAVMVWRDITTVRGAMSTALAGDNGWNITRNAGGPTGNDVAMLNGRGAGGTTYLYPAADNNNTDLGVPHVIGTWRDDVSNDSRLYINGQLQNSVTLADFTNTLNSFSLGAFYIDAPLLAAQVDIGEVLFYDSALSDADLSALYAYLKARWRL